MTEGYKWDTVVVGAGCAGLAAATLLAERGKRVLVLEKRPILGGRASSFQDLESGEEIDNGQHLFLGCYNETKEYLARIGSISNLQFTNDFETLMSGPTGEKAWLRSARLPAPWNLGIGILKYKALPFGARLNTLRVARAALRKTHKLHQKSVSAWLQELKQGEIARRRLWDLLVLATLNASPDEVPANLFSTVLSQGFLKSREASAVGLSKVGLSKLHGQPSQKFIEERGGKVLLKTSVKGVALTSDAVTVSLADGTSVFGKTAVLALPPRALASLVENDASLSNWVAPSSKLKPSPILSLHVWLNETPFLPTYVGFWDSEFHWAFRKSRVYDDPYTRHVSMVTSAATPLLDRKKEELERLCEKELSVLAGRSILVRRSVLVRESEATWVPPLSNTSSRLATSTPYKNLFLAGDWTDTGLPATIEGAVLSGHRAAKQVLELTSKKSLGITPK